MRTTVLSGNAFVSPAYKTLGNPAGFVLGDYFPDAQTMSAIARQAALPMTAFVVPRAQSAGAYDMRYYDFVGRESHICGHATTVVAAHLVAAGLQPEGSRFQFFLNDALFPTPGRFLSASHDGDRITVELFPSQLSPRNDSAVKAAFAQALGIEPADIIAIAFSENIRDYAIEVASTDILRQITPDFERLKQLAQSGPYAHEGAMVTARVDDAASEFDIHSRAFLPITGINEDIACGSANCSLIPYWAAKGVMPKHADGKYRSLFPYPPGAQGYYGGVQIIGYSPDDALVSITSHVEMTPPLEIETEGD